MIESIVVAIEMGIATESEPHRLLLTWKGLMTVSQYQKSEIFKLNNFSFPFAMFLSVL